MSDLRWAARFAFVDELWRDRTRIVVDASLERWLERRTSFGDAAEALLDDLLPRESVRQASVWMAVQSAALASRLSAVRPGTNFVVLDRLAELISNVRWDVLLLDGSVLGANEGPEALAARLAALRLGLRRDAAIVLCSPVREEGGGGGGLDYAEVSDVVAAMGGGRVFGLYTPPMAAIVDFGERVEAETGTPFAALLAGEGFDDAETVQFNVTRLEAHRGDPEDAEDDEDIPLTYDNSLGSQEPALVEFITLVGDDSVTSRVADGMSLIELPFGTTVREGLRAQLAQTQRQLERLEVQQQAQLQRAERLVKDNESLAERCAALEPAEQRRPEQGSQSHPDTVPRAELEAVLVREQGLKWRVGQLEREVALLMARPVETLEAEVAALRAVQDGPESTPKTLFVAPEAQPAADGDASFVGVAQEPPSQTEPERSLGARAKNVSVGSGSGPSIKTQRALLRVVDGLVRRIERGGIGTLQLRRELVSLRRRLQA